MNLKLNRVELGYLIRYALAGGLNAIVGLGSIFLLMHLGLAPLVANILGYAISIVVAFTTARFFFFRSKGKTQHDGAKYIASFLLSFGANLAALQISLKVFQVPEMIAQVIATMAYVITMFCLSRIFVFNNRK